MKALAAVGRPAFRLSAVRRAALAAAAVRGHGLVFVFHRIADDTSSERGLVPSVPESLFRRQIEVLLDFGDIVPLEALLRRGLKLSRPRFALTFDDDWTTHSERALPILRQLGVTATFFLSGRSLHGLGPLWFETLDRLIARQGVKAAGRMLGIETDDLEQLAITCENDPALQARLDTVREEVRHLTRAEIRQLADAGMTIGFHSLQHPLLTPLEDSALDAALTRGRRELEIVAGRSIRVFAYPHGKADPRAIDRLAKLGFVAAFTGRPRPVRPGDDPYLLGRWEPGAVDLDRFRAGVAARLNGWTGAA